MSQGSVTRSENALVSGVMQALTLSALRLGHGRCRRYRWR
jgi:hypothetical protein